MTVLTTAPNAKLTVIASLKKHVPMAPANIVPLLGIRRQTNVFGIAIVEQVIAAIMDGVRETMTMVILVILVGAFGPEAE